MSVRTEVLEVRPAADYRGTFAVADPPPREGGELPPGWEGLYFPFDTPLAGLRPDGSPAGDDVLPPVDLPRRMYAGEDTTFHRPLRYGEEVERTTALGSLVTKEGRSGTLVFADLVRVLRVAGEVVCETTWHDVFLDGSGAPAPGRRAPAATGPDWWRRPGVLDARQLFRFSATTFNTHRVHYDRDWAREVEGLPDLLVHGPLARVLVLDAARRENPGRVVAGFSYRSSAPLFVDRGFVITGHGTTTGDGAPGTEVLVLDEEGSAAGRGVVRWAS
ncbi:FAS1-like dehydratase domain-containing protein [Kineococcus sp. SYSU DK002]|uniref:FAS1-like dehydratase domain-containing protein n=1 Tax=Kineococcus sp. SYSU DK002 TaxID=3383123 RepID=UPI003D7D8540